VCSPKEDTRPVRSVVGQAGVFVHAVTGENNTENTIDIKFWAPKSEDQARLIESDECCASLLLDKSTSTRVPVRTSSILDRAGYVGRVEKLLCAWARGSAYIL